MGCCTKGSRRNKGRHVAFWSSFFSAAIRLSGARTRDPDKFKKDVAVLEKALEKEPDNSRYVYYLGQSYNCDGNREKSLEIFRKRISMGGSEEEIYHSLYMIGTLEELLNFPQETIMNSYCKAYAYRPTRASLFFVSLNTSTKNRISLSAMRCANWR